MATIATPIEQQQPRSATRKNQALEQADIVNRSWDELRKRGAKTVYPGHGPVYALSQPQSVVRSPQP